MKEEFDGIIRRCAYGESKGIKQVCLKQIEEYSLNKAEV
jgi:hypothetical protein